MSEKLNAGDVCNRIVTIAERKLSVLKAAQLMRDHHVGSVVVVEDSSSARRVAGILTDRDIVTSVVAKEVDAARLLVEDVMSSDVVTALEDDSVTDLLRTMRRKGLRRLPVVTAAGALVGLVTLDDLLTLMAEQLRDMALAIEAEQKRELKSRP